MQAPPAFQITVSRFGVWKFLLLSLAVSVGAALVAWWWTTPVAPRWLITTGCASMAAVSFFGLASLYRIRPFSLRWDTQQWALDAASLRGHERHFGHVVVAVDFGHWMLLRFLCSAEPSSPSPSARFSSRWLPLQRAGHETAWHALRCVVYASAVRRSDFEVATSVVDKSSLHETR